MPAGEQIALQPALAGVFGEDLHHPAVPARGARRPASIWPARPCRWPRDGAQPVGRGLVRADEPEVAAVRVGRHDVAQVVAEDPGRLVQRSRRACRPGRRSAPEVGQLQRPRRAGRRWRAGWRPAAGRRAGTPGERPRPAARRRRRRAPRAGRSAATSSSCRRWSGLSRTPDSGTWWARQVPSTGSPSTSCGPVQPFGRAQHDHRPAWTLGRALRRGPRAGSRRSGQARRPGRRPAAGGPVPGRRRSTRYGSWP